MLCEGPVLSSSTRWDRYWFKSPHSMYSVTIHRGSLLTHTPSSRMMFGSFKRDRIFTSFRKSFLKRKMKHKIKKTKHEVHCRCRGQVKTKTEQEKQIKLKYLELKTIIFGTMIPRSNQTFMLLSTPLICFIGQYVYCAPSPE